MERQRILRYLPENYQLAAADERGVMAAMLAIMEAMHAPVLSGASFARSPISLRRAPGPFVLMLASWLGLDRYFDWSGESRRRESALPGRDRPARLLIAEFP